MKDTMPPIRSFVGPNRSPVRSHRRVASEPAIPVETYSDLQFVVATLNYQNPHLNIFYRGQLQDHRRDDGASTLVPAAYRSSSRGDAYVYFHVTLPERSDRLKEYLRQLERNRSIRGRSASKDLEVFPESVWAILQHYECPTPLLDITSSLHVAASFATVDYRADANRELTGGYIYLVGLPIITGHITYMPYDGIVMVKLEAACPPEAKRPHCQQGYLIGSLPHTPKTVQYRARDVALRLVAKIHIVDPKRLWNDHFRPVPAEMMMPSDDPLAIEVQAICDDSLPRL